MEREVRQASLIGSFLKVKDFVYRLKRPSYEKAVLFLDESAGSRLVVD
ncbi:hypothetical protein RRU94_24600 [Domibacillus sp. DTU_2020_1001157_1_SI_ALB_TIR_016]|nr:hypothetical protein [Domibacillus sp. DTU_2020_1001157_1_SI_ALB_TIR_016]WNS80606.1 hypothetical protein RRU94_24600 [Domibacillus sp. DTU_2020_1001157_1_SI_ALB_TIR_016]